MNTFELVLQFDAHSRSDFDRLTEFEKQLEELGAELGEVDGHDFGSGEFNLFILTNDPNTAFRSVSMAAKREGLEHDMRAAYRNLSEERYVILWPPDLRRFDVL